MPLFGKRNGGLWGLLVLAPWSLCATADVDVGAAAKSVNFGSNTTTGPTSVDPINFEPGDQIQITADKKGIGVSDEDPNLYFHLQAQLENVCFETNYTDPNYQSEGFVLGRCDESYNTIIARDDVQICDGHSEENVRPGRRVHACSRA